MEKVSVQFPFIIDPDRLYEAIRLGTRDALLTPHGAAPNAAGHYWLNIFAGNYRPTMEERVRMKELLGWDERTLDKPGVDAVGGDGKYGLITASKKDFFPGEPLFLLRGTDPLTPATILDYRERCRALDSPGEHVNEVFRASKYIDTWQHENPHLVKITPGRPARKTGEVCDKAPSNWHCTRGMGHPGPCAAVPNDAKDAEVNALPNRLGGQKTDMPDFHAPAKKGGISPAPLTTLQKLAEHAVAGGQVAADGQPYNTAAQDPPGMGSGKPFDGTYPAAEGERRPGRTPQPEEGRK